MGELEKIYVFRAGERIAMPVAQHGQYNFEVLNDTVQNVPCVGVVPVEGGVGMYIHNKLEDLAAHIAAYLVFERQQLTQNLSKLQIDFRSKGGKEFSMPFGQEDKQRFYDELFNHSDGRVLVPFGVAFRLTLPSGKLEDSILVDFYKQKIRGDTKKRV